MPSFSGSFGTSGAPRWKWPITGRRSPGRHRPRCAKIGAADLATLLSNRSAADEELRKTIDAKSEPWGITVNSVEIRDIKIPSELQNALAAAGGARPPAGSS